VADYAILKFFYNLCAHRERYAEARQAPVHRNTSGPAQTSSRQCTGECVAWHGGAEFTCGDPCRCDDRPRAIKRLR
jgi:hypothetical protein